MHLSVSAGSAGKATPRESIIFCTRAAHSHTCFFICFAVAGPSTYTRCVLSSKRSSGQSNVTIALRKGVAISFCCRAGKIPYNQICLLTSFEPNKVYLGPNRNNKRVTITYFSGPEHPDVTRFPFISTTGTTSCIT